MWVWASKEGWRQAKEPHPYYQQAGIAKKMKLIFASNPEKICWWCGKRQSWWQFKDLIADHIVPMHYHSPTIIACRNCNYRRRGMLPDPDKLHRLLHSDSVVRSGDKKDIQKFLTDLNHEIFNSHSRGISMLIAKSGLLPVLWAPQTPAMEITKKCIAAGWHPPVK